MASFRKRGDKWEYRIIYRDPVTEKYKEKTKGGFRTKKEASVEAADIEEKIYLGQTTIVKSRDTLVKSWLTEWLEVYNESINAKTRTYRKHYINDILIPELGGYRLATITKTQYQRFINGLTKKYKKRTIQSIHSIFCTAMNKAVELEMLPFNKFQNVSIAKKDDVVKTNYLTKDEVSIFMDAAATSPFHHFIMVSLLLRTGMRKGEMLALTWDDIDLVHKRIKITKSRDKSGCHPPKTASSIRTIAIDDTLIDQLKQYQTWQKKERLKHKICFDSEYMLTIPNGREMGEYGVNKVINMILAKTNLHHITPHGLRHTHAIMLLESGADIKSVSVRLGHSSVEFTADVYVHFTKNLENELVSNLEAYLGK
ncbi:site-specific integrase [Sporolactobacillus shoreicorticis]|uniref:Tyrosine-type recombinase/integrase n=1 Tax=Sporolactobacillus shoreicorticis TaxID=1923877 RepID=A0ABW5S7Y8_9BACL|nr:tyrosine-type recombinase/integrase [Sporolactobacillus shoreicorticis]MCO7128236.1 site-specific integrase [Sporolactobacillus shoreicorticis]